MTGKMAACFDERLFQALPPLIGGKRRLLRLIFGALAKVVSPTEWRGLRFLDPFLGGGAVSLAAKWLGFDVVCGDLALRSVVVGKALIANSSVRLGPMEALSLVRDEPTTWDRIAERHSPDVFPLAHARFLDRALGVARGFPSPQQELALVALLKWVLRVQPMSQLRGTDARAAVRGDLDAVSPRRLGHYVRSQRLLGPGALFRLVEEVNGGVFPGRGEVHQMDALDFLRSFSGDVLYLDPPYPGTAQYENEYALVDELLEGHTYSPSRFSTTAAIPALSGLFEAAKGVAVWVVSMGGTIERRRELEEVMASHDRSLRAWSVPYRHLASIASARKNADNLEHLIVATRR